MGVGTIIKGDLRGLTPGNHGLIIHENAVEDGDCAAVGPHFNPFGGEHGNWADPERHAGDLGNFMVDERGTARFTLKSDLLWLKGDASAVGRTIVIYSGFDRGSKPKKPDPNEEEDNEDEEDEDFGDEDDEDEEEEDDFLDDDAFEDFDEDFDEDADEGD